MRPRRRPPPRAFVERLARAGPPPDRRDQARLAVGRPDRRRRATTSSRGPAPTQAGGAAAISVLCEPHWFGGSVDDLRRGSRGRRDPGPRQGVRRRRAPARAAARGRGRRRAAPRGPAPIEAAARARSWTRRSRSGWSHSSRCTTSASSTARSTTDARLIGVNNRDLRTLDGRPRARRPTARRSCPTTGWSSPSRASATPSTVARWRALGFDGALVGEALMRSADPTRGRPGVRRRRRGSRTTRPTSHAGRTSRSAGSPTSEGVSAAVLAGADAIGLNVVAGTPRAVLDEAEAAQLAELARALSPGGADRRRPRHRRTPAPTGSRPSPTRSIPMSSSATTGRRRRGATDGRPGWRVLHVSPVAGDARRITWPRPGRCSTAAWSGCSSTRPADRTRGGTGDPGRRRHGRGDRPRGAGHAGRRPHPGDGRRGAAHDPGDGRGCVVGRRVPAPARRAADARTRSGSRCS